MRILIDTNIFIYRENYQIIPANLQALLKTLNELSMLILVHPLSVQEIEKDRNKERREIILSKVETYPRLDNPPDLERDRDFLNIVGQADNVREFVDNNLLFCIYKNAVDFLITEDRGIHRKSSKLGISDRVFDIEEALQYFKKYRLVEKVPKPPALKQVSVYELDVNDPIFDSLKEDYPDFLNWWEKISREGRKALVYYKDERLGAILIYKIEEAIYSVPPLPKKRRLKISTFKVVYTGYKLGELFIKLSVFFAIRNDIYELYLTHFTKPDDSFVELIETFGFYKVAKKNGEDLFVKKLLPEETIKDPVELSRKFYPSFYDGKRVRKFIVPIRPEYHSKLFTDCQPRQPTLNEYAGQFIIEGNTIKKAYLCHSEIRNISEGDILLFYRSADEKKITTLGIIEKVYHKVKDSMEIIRYVGKRSVYNKEEIEKIAEKPTKVILFRQHFHLTNPLSLEHLLSKNILTGAPQSIVKIPHKKYLMIKKDGGINERFTVN